MIWKGVWSASTTYSAGDWVIKDSITYASLQGSNLNHPPPNAIWWSPVLDVVNDIKDYFVTHGMGTFGTDLFIGYMPDSPDQVTVLKAGGSWGMTEHHSAGAKPFTDFDCRAADSATAFAMVQAILAAMTDLRDLDIGSNHYVQISSQYPSPQQFYPWDDKNRVIWSGTLKIMMRPVYMASSY